MTTKKVVSESVSSSSKEEVTNGSIEIIEKSSQNSSSEIHHEELNGNRELETTKDDEQQKLRKKKVKKTKKSDTEKENISVVSVSLLLVSILKIFEFLYCNICLTLLNFVVVRFACIINFYHCLIFYVKLNGIKIFNRLSMLSSMPTTQSTLIPITTKPPPINGRDRDRHRMCCKTNYHSYGSKSLNNYTPFKSTSTNDLSIHKKSESLNCLAQNKTNKQKKITISSNVQLHDDDLSRINVKDLVRC